MWIGEGGREGGDGGKWVAEKRKERAAPLTRKKQITHGTVRRQDGGVEMRGEGVGREANREVCHVSSFLFYVSHLSKVFTTSVSTVFLKSY